MKTPFIIVLFVSIASYALFCFLYKRKTNADNIQSEITDARKLAKEKRKLNEKIVKNLQKENEELKGIE